jgi:hypothetical protein
VLRATLGELRSVGFVVRHGNRLYVRTVFSGSHPAWEPDIQAPMGTGFSGSDSVEGVSEPSFQVPTGTGFSGSDTLPYVVGEASSKDDAAALEVRDGGDSARLDGTAVTTDDALTAAAAGVTPCATDQIPWTEVHLLRTWFGVNEASRVQSWQAAWRTAANVATDYDPQAHLVGYLTRCHEQKRDPSPSLWLRFLIEDRKKHQATLDAQKRRLDMEQSADGGEAWALRSLTATPDWSGVGEGGTRP